MWRTSMDGLSKDFLEFFQTAAGLQGIDSSTGTIMGVLFMEPEEISMEELAEKTGYSLALICNKVKILEPSGIVKRIRHPHTKKLFLCMEKDMSQIIKSTLLTKQKSVIALGKEKLPEFIKKYKNEKLTDEQKKKLMIVEHYYHDLLQFEIMLNQMVKKLDELDFKLV